MPDSSSLLSTEPARAERLLHGLIRYGLLWLLALIVVFSVGLKWLPVAGNASWATLAWTLALAVSSLLVMLTGV